MKQQPRKNVSKGKRRKENKNKSEKLVKIALIAAVVVFAFVIYKIFDILVLSNEKYDLSGETYYQYFYGIMEEYSGKMDVVQRNDDIQLVLENGKVIYLDSTPIYYKNVLGKMLFAKPMELVIPDVGNYKLSKFTNIYEENNTMQVKKFNSSKSKTIPSGLFDFTSFNPSTSESVIATISISFLSFAHFINASQSLTSSSIIKIFIGLFSIVIPLHIYLQHLYHKILKITICTHYFFPSFCVFCVLKLYRGDFMSKNFDVSIEKQDQILRGKRIKYIRENELRLNKTDLAKQIGVSSQFLGLVEEGKSNLTFRSIKLLRNLSGHSADYIIFGLDDTVIDKTQIYLQRYTENELIGALDMLKELCFVLNRK